MTLFAPVTGHGALAGDWLIDAEMLVRPASISIFFRQLAQQ